MIVANTNDLKRDSLSDEFKSIVQGGTLATMVTFNPSVSEVVEYAISVARQVDCLVIIDNGSGDSNISFLRQHLADRLKETSTNNIELIENSENLGLPMAYNQAIDLAKKKKFKQILWLDQDTVMEEGAVKLLVGALGALSKSHKLGAVCAHNIESRPVSTDEFLRTNAFGDKQRRSWHLSKTVFAFNSGTMVPLETFSKIGTYDESMFLDCVDQEFCLRLRHAGLELFEVGEAKCFHSEGQVIEKKFLFYYIRGKVQPPFRYYYISRDTLRLVLRYYRIFPSLSLFLLLSLQMRLIRIMLFQSRKLECLVNFVKGISDFLKGVSGPITLIA